MGPDLGENVEGLDFAEAAARFEMERSQGSRRRNSSLGAIRRDLAGASGRKKARWSNGDTRLSVAPAVGWSGRSGSLWPTSIHRARADGEAAVRQIERNQQVDLWVGGPNGRVLAREISNGEGA